jgi:hypothetical protein
MEISCINCVFGEVVVSSGEIFTLLNPIGEEVQKSHDKTVLICREGPPTGGEWPEVFENDWCGKFQPKENVNE